MLPGALSRFTREVPEMPLSRFARSVIVIAAVVAALLVFLAVALFLPVSSQKISHDNFSRPGLLTTLSVNASNPQGCGTNQTDALSFPAHSFLSYHVSVNASGDTVRYWVGNGSGNGAPVSVVFGQISAGSTRLGASNATVYFVFQGCGTSGEVPYGFWGNFTLGAAG